MPPVLSKVNRHKLEFDNNSGFGIQPPVILLENGHHCGERLPEDMCGPSITDCIEDTMGRFWVTNAEYATQVSFCPFCGVVAPKKAEPVPRPGSEWDEED